MARKLDYKTCKKLLNDLSTNTQDKQYIDELLKINNCNLEEFSKGIAHQAFYIKGISSLQHVHNLKMDIQKQRLSAYEAELLLTFNNISGFEEALFELEKIKRKQDIPKKYKDLFEAAQIEANQKVRINSYQIDFAQMMHNKKELSDLQLQLRKSLDAELEKLENECYLA